MGEIRRKLLLALTVMLTGTGLAMDGAKAESGGNAVPIEVHDGYLIVVEGSIGRLHGLRFLVDTGASRSVIDRRIADKMRLPRGHATVINFDKSVRVESCQLPDLSFGPENFANLKMTVADLRYLGAGGLHVDAVIGWDLLRRKSFRLDFARNAMTFEPEGHLSGRSATIRPNDLFLMVKAEVDGMPVWMVADTGAAGATFYRERLNGMGAWYKVRGDAVGHSLGGAITARIASVSRFRLGTAELDRTVELVEAPLAGAPEGIAGYFGFAALRAKEIDFDFEKNELSWQN